MNLKEIFMSIIGKLADFFTGDDDDDDDDTVYQMCRPVQVYPARNEPIRSDEWYEMISGEIAESILNPDKLIPVSCFEEQFKIENIRLMKMTFEKCCNIYQDMVRELAQNENEKRKKEKEKKEELHEEYLKEQEEQNKRTYNPFPVVEEEEEEELEI